MSSTTVYALVPSAFSSTFVIGVSITNNQEMRPKRKDRGTYLFAISAPNELYTVKEKTKNKKKQDLD